MAWKTITVDDLRKALVGLDGGARVNLCTSGNEFPITCVTVEKRRFGELRLCEDNKEISVGETVLLDLMEDQDAR